MFSNKSNELGKISIALCTYNGEAFIEQQLQSILEQSRLPDEIILCDDGSTDNTIKIVTAIAKQAACQIVIHENVRNMGVAKNFEQAILKCGGDIIFLADQDDYWFPNKIERLLECYRYNNKIGLAYSDALITDSMLTPIGTTVFGTRGDSKIWLGMKRDPIELLYKPNIKGCTMALSRKFISKVLPIPLHNDTPVWTHDYWLACTVSAISEVCVIDEPLMKYRIHQNNASGLIASPKSRNYRVNDKIIVRYATSRLELRVNLYNALMALFQSLLNSMETRSIPRLNGYIEKLDADLKILNERCNIRSEKKNIKRFILVCRYLYDGKYFRFKRWIRQIINDLINRQGS